MTPRARVLSYVAWALVLGSVLAGSAGRDGIGGPLACAAGGVLVACGLSLDPDRVPRGMRAFTVAFGVFFVAGGIAVAATA